MAALIPIGPLLCNCKHKSVPILKGKGDPRMLTTVSCKNREQSKAETNKENKEDKGFTLKKFWGGVEKLGKGVEDNLSPKQKGDWKDITLMSLSFAVYVYMSQKIVCAYCAWMSMVGQH